MRKSLFLLLILMLWVPAVSAQDTMTIEPASGRYHLTVPADWVTATEQIRGLEGIFIDEIVVVGDSEAALASLGDINPQAPRTGKTLIANIFPTALATPGQPVTDAQVIFGTILGQSAGTAEYLEIDGLPAARTRDYFGPPYASATFAGQTMILDGALIYFIVYSAPDETGLAELEAIADTFTLTGEATIERPPFVTPDGVLSIPVGEEWLVGQSGSGVSLSYMMMTEPTVLLPYFFGGQYDPTAPGLMIQINVQPYDTLYGTSATTVTEEDVARTLDEAIFSARGVPGGEVEELDLGGATALRADMTAAFESDTNRAVIVQLHIHQKVYTLSFIGAAERWDEEYLPLINATLDGIEITEEPAITVGTQVGQFAPDFTLTLLDGSTVNLSDYRGQVVLLNFWATWCPPCREEMPEMETAYATADDFTILAVNMMENEGTQWAE